MSAATPAWPPARWRSQTPVWDEEKWRTYVHDKEIGLGDDVHRRFFPRLCNHCDNPPCRTVCPTGTTSNDANGIVTVDQDLCMGYRACMLASPYHARVEVTYGDVKKGREFYGSDYRRRHPSVDKCSFCDHRVAQGRPPACVQTGVGSARMFGDLDDHDNPIARMVASGGAKPLMPHIGTRPNVYYIDNLKWRG